MPDATGFGDYSESGQVIRVIFNDVVSEEQVNAGVATVVKTHCRVDVLTRDASKPALPRQRSTARDCPA